MRATGFVLAAAIVLGSAASVGASAPVPPDDPLLVPLLITASDLPPGWEVMDTPPLQADPLDPNAPPDPCNALAHQFDAVYSEPHAVAGFSSGGLSLLIDILFRLHDNAAASSLVNTFIADMAACPTVTGQDGLTTTYTALAFPALGDVVAAYKGTWQFGEFITLFVIIAAGDKVILLTETGAGDDTTLLESLAKVAVNRALAAELLLLTQTASSSLPTQTTQPAGKW